MTADPSIQKLPLQSVMPSFVGLIFILTLCFSSSSHLVFAGGEDPRIYSKDSTPYGIPYNQWLSKWWQWTQSIAEPVHPREHPSEQNCKVAQQGPVWFLADLLSGRQERTCTIPASKSILAPLVVGFCGADSPGVTDDNSLRQCAIVGNDYATMQVTLDGQEIKNLDQNRVQYGPFMLTYGDNNIYKHKPISVKGYVDGYYLILKPLSPGQHTLELKTSVLNPVDSSYNYSAYLIYHLTIKQ
jgi:hypothetical protein